MSNDPYRTADAWNDRLSEYLDGELNTADARALEAHLQDCAACRSDLEALGAVVARARTLHDAPPDADLWPGIAGRIAEPPAPSRPARRFSFTLPQLVAASLALMVLSGGMVWLARLGGERTDFPPIVADAPAAPVVAPVNFADASYDDAVADLQRTLEAGRASLDPQTVRILEDNLQAIDRAIVQCREALAADPANVYLNTYLAEARGRKLHLLRRAAAILDKSS